MSTGIPAAARPLQGQRAGIVTRLLSNTIDAAVVVMVVAACYVGWAALLFMLNPTTFRAPDVPFLVWLLVGGAFAWSYCVVGWSTTGRTYGKHLLGLRVVSHDGQRLRIVGAAVRATFCLVFLIGFLWVAVSGQNRSIQDMVLRTSVIYDWTRRNAPGPGTDPGQARRRRRQSGA